MAAPTDGAETVLAERVHNRDANKCRKHKNDVFKKCKYLPERDMWRFLSVQMASAITSLHTTIWKK